MSYLLDTCVLSELVRKQPEPRVIAWLSNEDESGLFVSELSLGEIEKGIARLRYRGSAKADTLEEWKQALELRFADRLLPIDRAVIAAWAELSGKAAATGRAVPVIDALLIATATVHGLTTVTRNIADFAEHVGCVNPWDKPRA